ncbi:glycosyltransferase [Hungatella sp. L12]|uniref:Glycosyltransferase n=1 Tax=Hungatella hominis TaxID=2763050 RepID=A0ABR7H8I8_9FIRM|nr:glycosyltransferase [Hungatella hominis]MBC5709489.1 glycosyltransferase [Hungatella hominis]
MKILWVTNQIIGQLAERKGIKAVTGQWLNAEINMEIKQNENKLVVCTVGSENVHYKDANVTYIVLGQGNLYNYYPDEKKIAEWKQVLETENPDIILIWGTEYAIGLSVLLANQGVRPTAIYIQGVMAAIYESYRGGLSDNQIRRFTTIMERIRKNSVFDTEKVYEKRALVEKQMIELCDYIILENSWSENIYTHINPKVKVLFARLPIREEFSNFRWKKESFHQHQIVTTAAGYPLKGIHQLIQAVSRIKIEYPDVVLMVPGNNMFVVKGIKNRIRQSGYHKYIKTLIKRNKLMNNVIFTGPLDSQEYARLMMKSEIFICASAIENHCSSLREAMTVGVPCIASKVGGVPEYAIDGYNCLLYNYGDIDTLVSNIRDVFESIEIKKQLSKRGKEAMYYLYQTNPLLSMQNIYDYILKERKCAPVQR